MSDDSAIEVWSDASDFEEPSATKAKKRPAENKESPKCVKRSKKRNKDGKKAAKMSAAQPKKISEPLDCKTIGAPSSYGEFLGRERLRRTNAANSIKEATQCVMQNGFMNRSSGGGSSTASSYGEQAGYPTQESLDGITREPDQGDDNLLNIAGRLKGDKSMKKMIKFFGKRIDEQSV
jgi:hypothetical protein